MNVQFRDKFRDHRMPQWLLRWQRWEPTGAQIFVLGCAWALPVIGIGTALGASDAVVMLVALAPVVAPVLGGLIFLPVALVLALLGAGRR